MRKAIVAIAIMAVAGVAAAQEKSALAGRGRYGTAGCGLGSMAFGEQSGMIQVLAATTNGLFGTQTFGISTGTSNCQETSGKVGTRTFIEANREALAKDISRGSGETIDTLSHLAGCADAKAVGAALQSRYGELFPSATAPSDQVTESILSTLKSEKQLACGQVG